MTWRFVTVAVLVAAASLALSAAEGDDQPGYRFDVLRKGNPFGRHEILFSRDGDDLVVDVSIELKVKLAFITVYKYSHSNRERWRDGQLVAIESETNRNGDRFRVSGRATENGFEVSHKDGTDLIPSEIRTTSYWQRDFPNQTQVLNTETGTVMTADIVDRGVDTVAGVDGDMQARRFDVSLDDGKVEFWLWYDRRGCLATIGFEAPNNGGTISYTPLSNPHVDQVVKTSPLIAPCYLQDKTAWSSGF